MQGGNVWGAEAGPKTPPAPPKKSTAKVGDIQTWPDCVYLGGNKDGATALGKAVIPQGRARNRAGAALLCLPCLALLLCLFASEEGAEGSWGGHEGGEKP